MSRYLALDWDQQLLHVVSGTVKGRTCTIQKAAVWQEGKSPNLGDAEELGVILKTRLKESGIAPAPVLASVPRDCVILKDLRIPAVPPHEEPALVRFQTLKELSHQEKDIVLDYAVLHGPSTASLGNDRRILAVVLRRELSDAYQKLCAVAGLKLVGITPRPFGLACGLQRVAGLTPETPALPGGDVAVAMVLITGRWGEFSVFRGDIPVLTRTITVGGNLGGELRRNLAVYSGQSPQHPVKAIYLAGDVSDEARAALGSALPDLPLYTFDPFAGVGMVDVPPQQRAGFTAAIGILHARARKAGLPINFLEPRQPRAPGNPYRALIYAAAAGLALLLGAGTVVGYTRYQARVEERDEAVAKVKNLDKRIAAERERGTKLKALAEWDHPVWLDEIYDLTQRMTDVDAMRVTRFEAMPMPRPTGSTSPYVAKVIISGVLLHDKNATEPLDAMIAEFHKDAAYSVEAPTTRYDTKSGHLTFTVEIKVSKRGPRQYDRKLS